MDMRMKVIAIVGLHCLMGRRVLARLITLRLSFLDSTAGAWPGRARIIEWAAQGPSIPSPFPYTTLH